LARTYLVSNPLFAPSGCHPRTFGSLAIIIPFRDDAEKPVRIDQLKWLLHYLIPLLERQKAKFQIFVISQDFKGMFNKGRLFNIGFAMGGLTLV